MKFGAGVGEDSYAKVKGLIADLIGRSQSEAVSETQALKAVAMREEMFFVPWRGEADAANLDQTCDQRDCVSALAFRHQSPDALVPRPRAAIEDGHEHKFVWPREGVGNTTLM